MLQRAASNAYSWWWASHIRTKQSKWLEQNLHDMEEKVRIVLKLIEEDGDSFAKRAEMYYKKRPELIQFVEESYRAYRALAERYDHLSTELQNANSTIAAVFPEQVQFAMDEEEEEASSLRFSKKPPEVSQSGNIPKVPKGLKNVVQAATKKMQATKSSKITSVAAAAAAVVAAKSGLTKTEALSEIDKLQKQILILQTEKEFVKSSYEGSLAQFQEIDLQIKEHQVKIFSLEDEFGEGIDIPNDDARNLMTATALKSCQETLDNLKVKQEKSVEEAETESRRIKEVRERIESLKVEFNCGDQIGPETKLQGKNDVVGPKKEKNPEDSNKEEMELSAESGGDLTVTEMAEKIDKLVNKVVGFEMAVSSQDALVSRLRTETDDILAQIRNLENDKESVIDGKNDLSVKVKEMEEKLREIQDLSSRVENKNNILQTHFTNTRCNLDKLSVKLPSLKPDEEVDHNKSQKAQNEAKLEIKVMEVSASIQTEQKEYPIVVAESPKDIIEQKESLESSKNSENVNIMTSIPPPYQAESSENAGVMPSTPPSHQAESSENADVLSITPSSHQAESSENGSAMPSTPSYQGNSSENADVMSSTPSHQEESSENAGVKSSTPPSYQATSSENTDVKSSTSPSYQATSSENTDVLTGSPPPHQAESSENADGMNSTPSNQVVEDNLDEKGEDPKVQEGEPDWRQLFMNGMQDKEKLLLTEYTTALRNYKELKKQLSEPADRGSQESTLDETSKQLKELEISNAIKDNEIQSLKQKLSLMQKCFYENKDSKDLTEFPKQENPEPEQEEQQQQKDENGHATPNSAFEERFRLRIDELLEENLEFWFQFSTSIQEIQKYETGIKDLLTEVTKLVQKQKAEGSSTAKYSLKSDARPIYKHLREIQTELTVWTEHSALLKGELQTRFSSLCNIQEEITAALKTSAEGDDFKFTSYQAAKFQGEVLNMKQENNRVADELQAGLDHGTTLQVEVEKALAKLNEEFQLSGSKKHGPESRDRPRVPLQSFIFGVKPKKQRPSILQCMNPAMYKKYHGMKSAPL